MTRVIWQKAASQSCDPHSNECICLVHTLYMCMWKMKLYEIVYTHCNSSLYAGASVPELLINSLSSHVCNCLYGWLSELSALISSTAAANEMSRQIERGARIVCAVPTDTKLVLQMPRGNLEVIYPRSLVLSATRRHLDKYVFLTAYFLLYLFYFTT